MELFDLERKVTIAEVFKEGMEIKGWIYCPPSNPCIIRPRALLSGKVRWIVKNGEVLDESYK